MDVRVGVDVAVEVTVCVGVEVKVRVGVGVGVGVEVGVGGGIGGNKILFTWYFNNILSVLAETEVDTLLRFALVNIKIIFWIINFF